MDLLQLRCFVAAAEEFHFGRAAQRLGMLPAAFGRHIRLLEEVLGTRLMERTTRSVALTPEGEILLPEARQLLAQAEALTLRFRQAGRISAHRIKVGAIDSAAAGLIPPLLHDFRQHYPEVTVHLMEDKTVHLLPRLLSGRLDLAFIRPPEHLSSRLATQHVVDERPVVAVPIGHRLSMLGVARVADLADEALIIPERRSRPHSHDLTIKLFDDAGLLPRIAQIADEKQTIVGLVATGLGVAIVPFWTSRIAARGVDYVPLLENDTSPVRRLPLAIAWLKDARDPARDAMMALLNLNLGRYGAQSGA